MKSISSAALGLGLVLSMTGCQFYSVSDADSTKSYLTHNWACRHQNGKATFTDMKTGEEVKLNFKSIDAIPMDEAFAEIAASELPPTR